MRLLLLLATLAFARPGGGEHYTPSPSPSPRPSPAPSYSPSPSYRSSPSTGSSTGATPIDGSTVVFLIGGSFAAFLVLALWMARASRPPPPNPADVPLLARAREVFDGVYAAWNAVDPDALRPFVSDGVYNRFATLLELQAAAGLRNETSVGDVTLRVQSRGVEAGWERAVIRVDVICVDRDISADGRRLREAPTVFSELWTFLRREGAVAAPSGCPACGAPPAAGATTRCASCGALSNSGLHTWVLAEITQMSAPAATPPSVHTDDPELSIDALEDAASTAFWLWIAAGVRGDPDLLRGVARVGLPIEAWRDVGVGSVATTTVLGDPVERVAEVLVDWTGTDASGTRRHRRTRLTFTAAAPLAPPSLATCACSGCGGPSVRSDAATCPWCDAPRGPAPHGWGLTELRHDR